MKKLLFLLFLVPSMVFGQAPIMPDVLQQFADANGVPLANGFVCTTITGTSTPLATYPTAADANAMTNPNTVPVVLDSAGRGNIWLGSTGTYRIAVYATTALGVSGTCNGVNVGPLIKTVDGVGEGGNGGTFQLHGVLYADTTNTFTNDASFQYNPTVQALSIQHTVNNATFLLNFQNTSAISGDGNGVLIAAGNTSSDFVLDVTSAGGANFLLVQGDGTVTLPTKPLPVTSGGTGNNSAWTNQGVLFATSTTATSTSSNLVWDNGVKRLTVTGNAGTFAAQVDGAGGTGANFGLEVNGGTDSSDYALYVQNGNFTLNPFAVRGDGAVLMNSANGSFIFTQAGGVTLSNSQGNLPLIVLGTNGTPGNSFGVEIQAGSNASDYALSIRSHAAVHLLDLNGDGSFLLGTLKTTGSAGSKKVVCVDTSTGQLYASSTSTDCSN